MTSAITRAPAGAAHAHGFAKSLKADTPVEGFEALFAAVAGAQANPPAAVVVGEAAEKGQGRARDAKPDEEKVSPQALLLAASMTLAPAETKVVDPGSAPRPANAPVTAAAQAAAASKAPSFENVGGDSMPAHAAELRPASQRIVPNAAFATSEPPAHALIAHKAHTAESRVPPPADPPRVTRTPALPETAASAAKEMPVPNGAPVPDHAKAEIVSSGPPSSPPAPSPAERPRGSLSPRALVQAVMVEVVRSPGRGRAPEAANADTQAGAERPLQAAGASKSPIAAATAAISAAEPAHASAATAPLPPVVEQAIVADAEAPIVQPAPTSKPAPASRAAADIARQREFVLGSGDASTLATTDTTAPTFETLIALRKADGSLENRAEPAPHIESISSPAPSGAWLGNLPQSSPTLATTGAAAIALPPSFDQAAWSAALAQQVAASAIAATRETTVRIKPDGLGPVEVRVRIESQHVDVRFAIEHPVTVNMVREALPELQRMLAQSGLSLGDAAVSQQDAGARGQAARSDGPSSPSEDEPVAIAAPTEARPRARAGLLDDFV